MNTINQEKKEKRKHIIEQEKWREILAPVS